MANRRRFLGTLGRVLGAGGLLLPWAGKGALALPADLGKAAALPVTAASLPFSNEALQLREIRRALHNLHLQPSTRQCSTQWRDLMVEHYRPFAHAISERPAPTWTDCVELAEIIWQSLDKERQPKRDGDWEYCEETGALSTSGENFGTSAYWCRDAIVALVEAVLTLGNGERRDPRTPQGSWPQAVRSTGGGERFSPTHRS